jgi:hypothetical protein
MLIPQLHISGNLTIKVLPTISVFRSNRFKDGMFNAKATLKLIVLCGKSVMAAAVFQGMGDRMINDEFEVTIDIPVRNLQKSLKNK